MEDAKDFLGALRRVVGSQCNQTLEKATCLAVFHSRKRKSTQQRERKLLVAIRMSAFFPHQRVATAFQEKHGIKISFSFKLPTFGAALQHLMVAGGQTVTNFGAGVARYPAQLDLQTELATMVPTSVPEETPWADNEGASTDAEEEVPAHQSLRGQTALVTASCPRQYPRDLAARKAQGLMIPEDFTKEEFLTKLRRTMAKHCTARVEKATCHSEPHKRVCRIRKKRVRHFHVALKMSGNFAHKKVADAFQKEHGIRISFSFKLNRFVGNLQYLMEPGKKASTDLDLQPAVYPPTLKPDEELKAAKHPGDAPAKESRKRKRLSFDELSNIVLEGIGQGPLHTAKSLEAAARELKSNGQVELWNYLGDLRTAADTKALVAKVWRLTGTLAHPLWHRRPEYVLSQFDIKDMPLVKRWLDGLWKSHVLILSGDAEFGKTSLAEALISVVSPDGYWFLDDPDDIRELEGELTSGQGLVFDEMELTGMTANQIKKLFDLAKTRRVKCRHFNGTIPSLCPRILCTNSEKHEFFPVIKSRKDRNGVKRRHLFQEVLRDVRMCEERQTRVELPTLEDRVRPAVGNWRGRLEEVCSLAHVARHFDAAAAAAERLGVAVEGELKDVAVEIADELGMTMLERRRFLSECSGQAVLTMAAPQLPRQGGLDTEDDIFQNQDEPDPDEFP